jgi:hypothetical protein
MLADKYDECYDEEKVLNLEATKKKFIDDNIYLKLRSR